VATARKQEQPQIIVDILLHHLHLVTLNLLLIPHHHICRRQKIFLDMNRKAHPQRNLQGSGPMQAHHEAKINSNLENLSLACSVISPKLLVSVFLTLTLQYSFGAGRINFIEAYV
jgi:hypothetical protein